MAPDAGGDPPPSRMDVRWADEDRPWLELRVTSIEPNGRVEQDLADARRALDGQLPSTPAPGTAASGTGEDRPAAT